MWIQIQRTASGLHTLSRPCKLLHGSLKAPERNIGIRRSITKFMVTRCYSLGQETRAQTGPDETGHKQSINGRDEGRDGLVKSSKEAEEEFRIKMNVLKSSLSHVNTCGWSIDALKRGALDLNLSESIASLCTPFDLVEYFQRYSNYELDNFLKKQEQNNKSLYTSVEHRLKLVIPYIDRYHEAMGISLEPVNIPRSLQVLRELSDIISIQGLGDTSTDIRWYAKRSGIISLYIATECCMVQDKSPEFQETWKFLERRVKDYKFFENSGSSVLPLVESGVTTVLNILGMNKKR